jgi:hypothetical protein
VALDRRHEERAELGRTLLLLLLIAAVVIAVVMAAGVAFGWTLTEAPSFDITTDPAGALPF